MSNCLYFILLIFIMKKDIIYAIDLGLRIIGMFIFCLYIGYKLDMYFHTRPILLIIFILLAFVYIMKLLLGVGKHE